jgi:hypothetical protein
MIQLSSLGSSLTTEKLHCHDPPSLGSGGCFTDGACYMLQQKETLAMMGTCYNNCLYGCVPLYFACGISRLLRRSYRKNESLPSLALLGASGWRIPNWVEDDSVFPLFFRVG